MGDCDTMQRTACTAILGGPRTGLEMFIVEEV